MASVVSGLLTTTEYRVYSAGELGAELTKIGLVGMKDRVIGVYAVPSDLFSVSDGKISNDDPNFVTLSIARPSALDGYSNIKNKKLLTYPYVYASVSSGGSEHQYVFEKSTNANNTLTFNIYGIIGTGPKIFIMPTNYDHMDYNFNCAFEEAYPQLPIAIAPFIELLGNNGIVTKLLPLALTYAAMKVPAQQPMPVPNDSASPLLSGVGAKDRIAGGLSNIQKAQYDIAYQAERKRVLAENMKNAATLDKLHVASHTVPQITGTVNLSNINYTGGDVDTTFAITLGSSGNAYRIKGAHGFVHCVRAREAENIDNFFTMYGYTCDKVKVPNIHARPKFTYVKTQGCRIKPKNNGVPAGYMDAICSIYDSGITFWDSTATVGDYTVDNSPVQQGGGT